MNLQKHWTFDIHLYEFELFLSIVGIVGVLGDHCLLDPIILKCWYRRIRSDSYWSYIIRPPFFWLFISSKVNFLLTALMFCMILIDIWSGGLTCYLWLVLWMMMMFTHRCCLMITFKVTCEVSYLIVFLWSFIISLRSDKLLSSLKMSYSLLYALLYMMMLKVNFISDTVVVKMISYFFCLMRRESTWSRWYLILFLIVFILIWCSEPWSKPFVAYVVEIE